MANDIYTQIDPFTETLQALWDFLESHVSFTSRVAENNRIKIQESVGKPEKTKLSKADTPQVTIYPSGNGNVKIHASSSTVDIEQQYSFVIIGGDKRPTKNLLELKWVLFRILSKLDKTLGLDYIQDATLMDMTEDKNLYDHPGWNVVFDIVFKFSFERNIMKVVP